MNNKTAAIIVAGGTGNRMGTDIPKQFLKLKGREILLYSVDTLSLCPFIDKIVIVCHPDYLDFCRELVSSFNMDISVVCGGSTRQESVFAGLEHIKDCSRVLVHDAVRCMVSVKDIQKLHTELLSGNACTLAVKVKDTIKLTDDKSFVTSTLPRELLWQIQTPQAFDTKELYEAHLYARSTSFAGTDDCSLMEHFGKRVRLVEGSYENIKITTPSDLKLAEIFMEGCE